MPYITAGRPICHASIFCAYPTSAIMDKSTCDVNTLKGHSMLVVKTDMLKAKVTQQLEAPIRPTATYVSFWRWYLPLLPCLVPKTASRPGSDPTFSTSSTYDGTTW